MKKERIYIVYGITTNLDDKDLLVPGTKDMLLTDEYYVIGRDGNYAFRNIKDAVAKRNELIEDGWQVVKMYDLVLR